MTTPDLFVWVALLIVSCAASSFYTAAVVEHAPYSIPGQVSRTEALAVMNINLDKYEEHISAASELGAQIIVFPEDGLFGDDKCTRSEILPYLEYIPDPQSSSTPFNPCNDAPYSFLSAPELLEFQFQPVLSRISCLAKQYNIVIVLDMGDIQPCSINNDPNCPSDNRYQYNTQVAFDENGNLLQKYHKTHLFYEPQYNPALPSDPATFTTSFGVKFAMMICFDMMFGYPSLDYAGMDDVYDLVYSTWWVNTPPDFSASQIQQAWSRTMNLNLLAAGNGVSWLYSGSGIYSRGHVLEQQYNPTYEPEDKLLVTQVPIFTSKDKVETEFLPEEKIPQINISPSFRNTKFDFVNFESVHCPPSNSTGNSTVPPAVAPWKNSKLLDSSKYWDYSYGDLALAEPFNATWGETQTFSTTAANLTCTIEFSVSESQPFLIEFGESVEYYTLLAYHGWYDGETDYYKESFCAFYRCRTSNIYSCFESLIFAGTIFESFRLEGTFAEDVTLYGLTATDELRLIEESDKIVVDFDKDAEIGYIEAVEEFDTILLNASLLGRILSQDDSDVL